MRAQRSQTIINYGTTEGHESDSTHTCIHAGGNQCERKIYYFS